MFRKRHVWFPNSKLQMSKKLAYVLKVIIMGDWTFRKTVIASRQIPRNSSDNCDDRHSLPRPDLCAGSRDIACRTAARSAAGYISSYSARRISRAAFSIKAQTG
jgi:hypothetical protein